MTTATRQAQREARADVQVLAESAVDYHRRTGESSSRVNLFLRSPRLYQSVHVLQEAQEERESNALDLGTGEHAWVFEPEKFERYCAIVPEEVLAKNGACSTNAYRAWEAEQGDRAILKPKEWEAVKRMRQAIYRNDLAAELLGGGDHYELTICWHDAETGMGRRSRLDCITTYRGRRLIVDLKTATDHSPEAFEKAIRDRGYGRQAAFYQDAYEAVHGERPGFVFLVVRAKAPHCVRCYDLGEAEMELGRRQVSDALVDMAERYRTGSWAEVGEDRICQITHKPWAFSEFAA